MSEAGYQESLTKYDDMFTDILREHKAKVKFYKVDGSIREMMCTLKGDLIPDEHKPTTSNKPKTVGLIRVYDLEMEGWRSFRVENVTQVDVYNDFGEVHQVYCGNIICQLDERKLNDCLASG